MNSYQQQIARIWKNEMSSEEKKAFLNDLLQQEPAWKALLQEEYNKNLGSTAQHLSEERADLILQRLHAAFGETPRKKIIPVRSLVKWMAAAAVLVIMGTVFYQKTKRHYSHSIVQVIRPKTTLLLQSNYTTANRQLQLEDGSIITMAPGAAVRYYHPFINNKRDISLQGQAWFTVARDTARPFTVYAGNMTTTALGTIFMINTAAADKMEVRLYEGKVVIRSADSSFAMRDVYLQPGEQFDMHTKLKQIRIYQFDKNMVQHPIEKRMDTARMEPLEFTQQPLQDVLTGIGKRYKVRFVYDTAAIAGIQVTGKFLPSDALQTVLSMLGTVNGLSFTVQKNTITVSKIK